MYCDDSRGTDIDHFEPLERAPLRAFVWVNHLLACSFCNSNQKNRKYPVDAEGACLLVDPTAEDPADHLTLRLSVGTYDPLSPKGEETIQVFGLNRSELVKGRPRGAGTAGLTFHRCRTRHDPSQAGRRGDRRR
jgi:hypothetical protein